MTGVTPGRLSGSRRSFLQAATAAMAIPAAARVASAISPNPAFVQSSMKFGLVTYLWGQDMDLPTVIDACEKSGLAGVELRTEHKHAVEPRLSKTERAEVRKRFESSKITLVGYGSNAQFHENDPAKVEANIELAKQYIHLMHDCGGSGVKVKPNSFVQGVPREQTIEQIGKALNVVGEYGQKYGQQIRVEVHGSGTSELPVMKAIMDVASHPNVTVCWNSNVQDLKGDGLEHNFRLVCNRFGKTAHVRQLDATDYPWDQLFRLFHSISYDGWVLLEAQGNPDDKIAALKRQKELFDSLVKQAVEAK